MTTTAEFNIALEATRCDPDQKDIAKKLINAIFGPANKGIAPAYYPTTQTLSIIYEGDEYTVHATIMPR